MENKGHIPIGLLIGIFVYCIFMIFVTIKMHGGNEVYADEIPAEPQIIDIQVEETNSFRIGDTRNYDDISFIVIHHTATRDDLTAEEMKLSMKRTYIHNRGGKTIPAHYIIDKRGNLQRVNPINIIVGATLNPVANVQGIHIELVGDFNQHNPTQEQYDTLNSLIKLIEDEIDVYLPLRGHKDFQNKNCPGINFDWSKVWNSRTVSVGDAFYREKITAYYTPLPTDSIFSHGTYEASKKVNGDFVNAMGWDYKEDHKYTHGACGRRREFGTIFEIEGRGKVVCVDRGSAINNASFDIRYGIGEDALRNIRGGKIHPQQSQAKVLYMP